MSYSAQRQAIESRFQALFTGLPIGQVVFANVAYTPVQGTPYVRLTIKSGDSERLTIGAREHRNVGLIIAQVFTPIGTGSNGGLVFADEIAAIYRDQEFDGVLCRSPYITEVGPTTDWFQINVSIPFKRDEVFA